jgi:hypothetical protein
LTVDLAVYGSWFMVQGINHELRHARRSWIGGRMFSADRRSALILLLVLIPAGTAFCFASDFVIPLKGEWRFQLDREDKGIAERWFTRELDSRIRLPGSLQEQGFGDDVTVDTQWTGDIIDRSWFTEPEYAPYRRPGNIKVPFWLTPDKHYVGVSWFQREVNVPAAWEGSRVVLTLERPHWETTLWVDGERIGSNDSLSVPHVYDLSGRIGPGRRRLTLRVDNRMVVPVGVNSHSVSDHTQSNWNGVVGEIRLYSTSPVWIEDLQVFPDVANRSARVRAVLGNRTGREVKGTLFFRARSSRERRTHDAGRRGYAVDFSEERATVEFDYPLGRRALLWDEFSPALYRLEAVLESRQDGVVLRDTQSATFGLREIKREGRHLLLNGRRMFLRGTLECAIFPLTGYPPTDVDSWKRIVRIAKDHGLNHIRFHSWCPPKAAFEAADELGFYYQVECSSWANQGASIGYGERIDDWIREEGERILRAYGNHPSFIMMAYGNEPAGENQRQFLGQLVTDWRDRDKRRVYTSAAGWPIISESDFHSAHEPRIHAWGAGLTSRINALPPETVTDYRDFVQRHEAPVVSHEIGQWCVYPNFEEIPKYKGVLKAANFEIFRDGLRSRGLLHKAKDFFMASGKLQTLCYKEEIESSLRTPDFGGFQLLDLHDFPGQGTALVGVLDPFWDSKGYVTPEQFRRFSGETVPLARMSKRIFTSDEVFSAQIEVSHFGPADLNRARPVWLIKRQDGTAVASGQLPLRDVRAGTLVPLGEVRFPLDRWREAEQLVLEVRLDGTPHANDWDFWVYPAEGNGRVAPLRNAALQALIAEPEGVVVSNDWDAATIEALDRGGTVLLLLPPDRIKGDHNGRVPPGFSSIFWNTAWTSRQAPHTLGILCDPQHAAFEGFPTDYHSNWQWWELVTRAHPFILNDLPHELEPLVYLIDDWVTNRKLGLLFEARVGQGRLLACGIDLLSELDQRPVARQLRAALLRYVAGDEFKPSVLLSVEDIKSLLEP